MIFLAPDLMRRLLFFLLAGIFIHSQLGFGAAAINCEAWLDSTLRLKKSVPSGEERAALQRLFSEDRLAQNVSPEQHVAKVTQQQLHSARPFWHLYIKGIPRIAAYTNELEEQQKRILLGENRWTRVSRSVVQAFSSSYTQVQLAALETLAITKLIDYFMKDPHLEKAVIAPVNIPHRFYGLLSVSLETDEPEMAIVGVPDRRDP